MSWSPRRLVSYMKDWSITVGKPHFFWLKADAVDRVLSAVDNNDPEEPTVLFTDILPRESVIVGLEKPITTMCGDVFAIGVPGLEAIRDNLVRQSIQYGSEQSAQYAAVLDSMPIDCDRPLALYDREGKHIGGGLIKMPSWEHTPKTKEEAEAEQAALQPVAGAQREVKPILYGEDAARITEAVRTVWTLHNTPTEREATATTVTDNLVRGGSKDVRDYPFSIVNITLPPESTSSGVRSDPSGDPRDYQYRWEVRKHERWQAYGPGRSLRRKVLIQGYIKGPEDKPLKQRIEVVHGGDVDRVPPPQPATVPEPDNES